MINIKNLNCSINGNVILNDITVSLPHYGLVSIVGNSGCGKTTLLNCISGLIDYRGDILFDNKNFGRMNENDLSIFRLKNIGFVFQDFKLFEFISAKENVLFPLNMLSNFKKEIKERKCDDLLEIVGMKGNKLKPIKKMSGGEKQRIAIARALVNDPKIILADEPTGALDEENAEAIMKILSKVSKGSLVIVVTHDTELARKYSDQIIEMKDGKISKVSFNEKREIHNFVPLSKNFESNKKPNLPFSFLLSHAKHSLRNKKWRTRFCNFVTSLGLLAIGLTISLSSSISNGIRSAYSSIIDDSRIVINVANNETNRFQSLSEDLMQEIVLDNKETVSGYGIAYKTDFESFFKDENKCILFGKKENLLLENYSARSINEFVWLSDCVPNIYTGGIKELQNDEIILSLNSYTLNNICYSLQIERTIESLSNYLKKNKLKGYFSFANSDWTYTDEFLFTVKGFVIDFDPYIIHSNRKWNEYVFEDTMRFPTNTKLYENDYYPWVMKKYYFLNCKDHKEALLKQLNMNNQYENYVFDIADESIYPWMYRNKEIEDRRRIVVLENLGKSLPYNLSTIISDAYSDLSAPIYGTDSGYSIYAENMMIGFSHPMYFSSDKYLINGIVDVYSSVDIDSSESVELPNGILMGHFSKTLQSNVIFNVFNGNLLSGTAPNSYKEIVISKGLALKLFGNLNCINKKLCTAYANEEIILGNSKIKRNFSENDLSIVGVVDSDRLCIYHETYWTIGFFQTVVGISSKELVPSSLSFNCSNSDNAKRMAKLLEEAFPQYVIINPENIIKESVDGVTKYLNIVLVVFSIVCSLISIILLYLCNLIHAGESRKDVGLSCCIGMRKKESKKFIYFHSVVQCFSALILASLELIAINIVTSIELSNSLGGSLNIEINPLAFILMSLFAIIISTLSSAFLSYKYEKTSPLDLLK